MIEMSCHFPDWKFTHHFKQNLQESIQVHSVPNWLAIDLLTWLEEKYFNITAWKLLSSAKPNQTSKLLKQVI